MALTIQPLNRSTLPDVNRCDGSFTVDSVLALRIEDGLLHITPVPVEPYMKRYPQEDRDWSDYIENREKALFLAYLDGKLAGQVQVRLNWNRFACIEDVVVDAALRRHGVGRALIERAVLWAAEKELPGVMLETQNNNVAACRLYESCGFELAGFDRYLYRGLDPYTEEIALYWYLVFDLASPSETL